MSWSYAAAGIHRTMLLDDVRNRAFQRAIEAAVKPGDVVLDAGAGCGILSLFAARAGAKRVYAVEKTGTAALARLIIERNGLADRIIVLQADMETVSLPESVDVIVSEWLGTIGVDENLLAPLLTARDRYLKAGGRMLPERVTAWMAPVTDPSAAAERVFYRDKPYGFDLSSVFHNWPHEMAWARWPLSSECLLAEPKPMWTHHVHTLPAEQAGLPFRASLEFKTARAAELDGLALWFQADFGDRITLTNAPGAPPTHWIQYVLPLEFGGPVTPGTTLAVEFACIPALPGYCHNAWSARIGRGRWEHHDTRCA